MPKEPTLKEQYFRTGYVVELRNGHKFIVLRDEDDLSLAGLNLTITFSPYGCLDDFSDELEYKGIGLGDRTSFDIVKVYDRVRRWKEDDLTLIWQREEVKEITIGEAEHALNKGLGYNVKVKIVGGEA